MPPRKLLPRPPPARGEDQVHLAANVHLERLVPKRRLVNQACENCRRRKTKCNDDRPRCAPCIRANLHCHFAPSKAVDTPNRDYRGVVELLRHRSETESTQILQKIRETDNLDGILGSIVEADLLLQAVNPSSSLSTRPKPQYDRPVPQPPRAAKRRLASPLDDSNYMFEKQFVTDARYRYVDPDLFVDITARNLPISRWTEASDDDKLMNHLLRMFWTWDNIVERCFYRPLFEEDVASEDVLPSNKTLRFCSRFQVNAVLAASCLYTMDPATFKYAGDTSSRGRRWADEADKLLAGTDVNEASIPLLQGLICMFVYEGNLGMGTRSMPYYMRAMDVYKALNQSYALRRISKANDERAQRERHGLSWCMWGFYCLEWRGTQALGFRKLTRMPRFPKVWREPEFPFAHPESGDHWWYPYPMTLKTQKSMKVEIREVDAILSEIVEEILDFLHPGEGEMPTSTDPQRAMKFYKALAEWKLSCPSRLRLEEATLPAAILLHISVEIMFTAILRPFAHMSKEQFGKFDPRERCYAHASSLASAIWTFRAFACLRFEYWLCHAIGTAGYIAVSGINDAPIQMDTLLRACQCLYEMRVSLPLATDILCGIHAGLKLSGLPVPTAVGRYFDQLNHRKDGLMHLSVAALIEDVSDDAHQKGGKDVYLQELLQGLENIEID